MTKRMAPGDRVGDSDMRDPVSAGEALGAFEDHVYLIGRPPIGEFLGYVATQTLSGPEADRAELMNEWRAANNRVRQLESTESGAAEGISIRDLPHRFESQAAAVRSDPIFRRAFSSVPTAIKMVELDRLVVFQKQVNLGHVRRIQRHLGEPSPERIFDLCLPVLRETPSAKLQQVAGNLYVVTSPSNDLRFVEPIVLRPQNVSGYSPLGPVVAIIGLVVGYSSNYLQAVHIEGRLVLHNGSNRAYALRELGIKEAPCLVQEVTRREELEVVASAELTAEPDRYLKVARPPLLKDYFEPELRKHIRVPVRNRQLKLGYGIEALDTPA